MIEEEDKPRRYAAIKGQKDERTARVQKFLLRLDKASMALAPKHEMFNMLDKFDRGEQWKDASIPPWVPKPVTNYIRFGRTTKRANLASAIPSAHYTAKRQEYAEYVERLYRAYKHVWETEKVPRTIRRCVDRAVLQGTAIAVVYNDDTFVGGEYYGKNDSRNALYHGKICVKRFPNGAFFNDPDATCLEDCKFIDTAEITTLNIVKSNPKFRKYAGRPLEDLTMSQITGEQQQNGEIYDRDYYASQDGMSVPGDEIVELRTHWERYINDNGRWQVDVSYYLKNCTLELYRIENLKPSVYPFAVLYDEEEEGDFWGTSMMADILENQKIISKTAQTYSIIGTLHQNPQKVVSRESGINGQELARTSTMPGRVWTANGDPRLAIHNVEVPDIPRGLFEVDNQMKTDVREMLGINEAYTGESVGSLTTSTGVNALIERATIRDKDKMIQIDEFVEQLSNIIILMIAYKWKEKRPITIMGRNGQPQYEEYEPINDDIVENLDWIVKSNIYASAPLTQALKKQQADQLMQLQGQFNFDPPIITPEEWVRKQDFEDQYEILQRMEEDRRRKEAREAEDLQAIITQMSTMASELSRQGLSEQEVQQQVSQAVSELLQQREQSARQRDAAAPSAPQGTTGQLAMAAMARGA